LDLGFQGLGLGFQRTDLGFQRTARCVHRFPSVNPRGEALKLRTKQFALDVIDFVETLPNQGPASRIALQLVDAATSVAANYRATCRSRSKAEFAAKIGQVLEQSDESLFWLELTDARQLGAASARSRLMQEANELTAIFAASAITVKLNAAQERQRSARR
jgi:four helix bundle protein